MLPNLNPDQLAACYEFLRSLEPFNGYSLPHADEVEFTVAADSRVHGIYALKPSGGHEIIISRSTNGHVSTLTLFMAHEMIHLYQAITKTRNKNMHNAEFMRIAAEVCMVHGYDPQLFV